MKILFFVGTGATGKTSVANILKEKGCFVVPSFTREFYASKGVNSEKDFFELPYEGKVKFQTELNDEYHKYVVSSLGAYVTGKNSEELEDAVVVFERSPFCHMGYIMYHCQSENQDFIVSLYNKTTELIREVVSFGDTLFVQFPFPTPFCNDMEDGFRHIPYVKNLSVHANIEFFMDTMGNLLYGNWSDPNWDDDRATDVFSSDPKLTPEQRAEEILDWHF